MFETVPDAGVEKPIINLGENDLTAISMRFTAAAFEVDSGSLIPLASRAKRIARTAFEAAKVAQDEAYKTYAENIATSALNEPQEGAAAA